VGSDAVERAARERRLQDALADNAARRNRRALSADLGLSEVQASVLGTAAAKDIDSRAAAFAEAHGRSLTRRPWTVDVAYVAVPAIRNVAMLAPGHPVIFAAAADSTGDLVVALKDGSLRWWRHGQPDAEFVAIDNDWSSA
jgi:hypothetical protein